MEVNGTLPRLAWRENGGSGTERSRGRHGISNAAPPVPVSVGVVALRAPLGGQEHDGEPLGPGGGASRQRGAVVPGLRSTLGRCPSNCKPSKSPALCSWRGPHVIAIVGEVVLFAIVAGPASTAAPSCPATAATAPSATTPPHLSSLPLARPHSKPSSL
ncbi:hypothetical protein Purlil1_9007 [Purpureocillium lilacinum]|uniref:Uncharacterized protein n=1 Tax=Purpureocillium lilacinum TaxID=33203 RepID=A0ABR0BRL9_PURLI|nr:hypothetical protein Purlil1_9007 [Purpureocillium lilacinum]